MTGAQRDGRIRAYVVQVNGCVAGRIHGPKRAVRLFHEEGRRGVGKWSSSEQAKQPTDDKSRQNNSRHGPKEGPFAVSGVFCVKCHVGLDAVWPDRAWLATQNTAFPVFDWSGLLLRQGCANLDFCAVERAERECVRALLRDWFSGARFGFPGGMGWRSSAGRASDLQSEGRGFKSLRQLHLKEARIGT
jgi:hypothetical protein